MCPTVGMLHAGSKVDSIDFWAQRVHHIETAIQREQHRILGGLPLIPFIPICLEKIVSAPFDNITGAAAVGKQCCMFMHGPSSVEMFLLRTSFHVGH